MIFRTFSSSCTFSSAYGGCPMVCLAAFLKMGLCSSMSASRLSSMGCMCWSMSLLSMLPCLLGLNMDLSMFLSVVSLILGVRCVCLSGSYHRAQSC